MLLLPYYDHSVIHLILFIRILILLLQISFFSTFSFLELFVYPQPRLVMLLLTCLEKFSIFFSNSSLLLLILLKKMFFWTNLPFDLIKKKSQLLVHFRGLL